MIKVKPQMVHPKTHKGTGNAGHDNSGRVYCPRCIQTFQGEHAQQRYKEHWRQEHGK